MSQKNNKHDNGQGFFEHINNQYNVQRNAKSLLVLLQEWVYVCRINAAG